MTQHSKQVRHRPTLELRVRSLAPDGARDELQAVITRLDQLDADGTIEGYVVRVWGKKFCPTTAPRTEPSRSIHERLVELDEWAARTGLSVAPFFQMRTGRSEIDGTIRASVVHPMLVLAEYVDDKLRHVSPCTDGESTYPVANHLDALENGDERVPKDPDHRPMRVPAIVPALQDAKTRDDD